MTIHIVPVGLSLADTLTANSKGGPEVDSDTIAEWENGRFGFEKCDMSSLLDRVLGEGSALQDSEPDIQKFKDVAQAHRIDNWGVQQHYSVEIDAIKSVDPHLKSDDLILLLASHTFDGLLCAALNALALAKGNFDLLWYRPTVSIWHRSTADQDAKDNLVRTHRRQIVIMGVENLDVETHYGFKPALKDLTELGDVLISGVPEEDTEIIRSSKKEEIRFHLTGGYRTTLPYLLAVAEWVNSLVENPVSAHLIPRKDLHSAPVPLRRLDEHQVRSELAEFGSGNRCKQNVLGNSYLLGYAYEVDERASDFYKLTDFGVNMRLLFGDHKEAAP